MRFVLYAIVAYILYQFIFKLVIPVYIASRRIKKGFAEMQQKMHEQAGHSTQSNQQGFKPQSSAPNPGNRPKSGDYIEFEEVK